ncbi:MAG: nucleotide exchange factor GrpE [Bacteroidales bacterium]|nr:nucleotide exchange factor GrpE [Bacteroidales bacterium]
MENDNIQEEKKVDEATENVENKEVNSSEPTDENEAQTSEPEKKEDSEQEHGKKKKSRFGFYDRKLKEELAESNRKLEELQDKYMRQVAEFSNFKKRTAKEKLELRESVKASMLHDFLPVINDIDRAMEHLSSSDIEATKEGVKLIYQKFMDYLKSQDLTEIQAMGEDFNTDFHEAVTQFPVEDEAKKGKVIDVIQKGYKINDKVVRYSKVVVGQ